jgi:methionyl-tRNA formyltransferase
MLHNLIRGLHPWPHASTVLAGRRVLLLRSRIPHVDRGGAPGTIMAARGDLLRVATGNGALDLVELQPEGKRPMAARDFLAGYHLAPGERLAGG